MKKLTGYTAMVLACAHNGAADLKAPEAHVATPKDKKGALALAKLGFVTIRKTNVMCAGFKEWWVTITEAGMAHIHATYPTTECPVCACAA